MRLPPWLPAVWRLVRIPVILVALYFALRPAMSALSEQHGFDSPAGFGVAYPAVAGTLLALRIVLLVVLPAAIAYRAVAWALTHVRGRPRRTRYCAEPGLSATVQRHSGEAARP